MKVVHEFIEHPSYNTFSYLSVLGANVVKHKAN